MPESVDGHDLLGIFYDKFVLPLCFFFFGSPPLSISKIDVGGGQPSLNYNDYSASNLPKCPLTMSHALLPHANPGFMLCDTAYLPSRALKSCGAAHARRLLLLPSRDKSYQLTASLSAAGSRKSSPMPDDLA